jgi:hypothetical protein
VFTSLFIAGVVFMKKILKKEDLQYNKHNKKFNDDYHPDFSSPTRHVPESIIIKME